MGYKNEGLQVEGSHYSRHGLSNYYGPPRGVSLADYLKPGALRSGLAGLGYYSAQNLESDLTAAKQAINDIEGLVNAAQQTYAQIKATGVTQAISDADARMTAINNAAKVASDARGVVSGISMSPQGGLTDMYLGSMSQKIGPVLTQLKATLSALPNQAAPLTQILSGAQMAAKQAAAAQAAAAQAQAAADAAAAANAAAAARATTSQKVTNAILSAQSMAGQRNFAGALAALQDPTVIAAAEQTGRTGEIQAAIAGITGMQQAANDANQQRLQAEAERQRLAQEAQANTLAAKELAIGDRQFQMQLEQMRQEALIAQQAQAQQFQLSQQQFQAQLAAQAAEQARLQRQEQADAQKQQALLAALPGLLQSLAPAIQSQAPAAMASGQPSPIAIALLTAIANGDDPMQALVAALQAGSAPPPAPAAPPPPSNVPARVQWNTSETF